MARLGYWKLTLSNKAFVGVCRQPRLAVGGLVGLLDELKLAGNLSVVDEAQRLSPVLHVFHILKVELEKKKKTKTKMRSTKSLMMLHFLSTQTHQLQFRLFIQGASCEVLKSHGSVTHGGETLPLALTRSRTECTHFPFCRYRAQSLQRSACTPRYLFS